jgi:hypothetical protein
MNSLVLLGILAPFFLAKGARIPSTAEDDAAEMRNPDFREALDLRCGLDCFRFMQKAYASGRGLGTTRGALPTVQGPVRMNSHGFTGWRAAESSPGSRTR